MDNSKNLMNNDKSLCLYCDKAFSSINDQENHVERDHKTVLNNKGKWSLRKSERITKNLCSENTPFPGCFYCNNRKLAKSDDLESLFQHLLNAHKDIYFGCKCRTRMHDKISFKNHKKNCKIGGGKNFHTSDEKVTEKRKITKKSQLKTNVDSKCDHLSEYEENGITAAANSSVKSLPINAISKKSDRNSVKNINNSKSAVGNEKRNKSKISSSSSSSSKTSDEYTIPLTRQKLKEPVNLMASTKPNSSQNRLLSNKKSQKNGKSSSLLENKNALSTVSSSSSSSTSSSTKVQRTKTTKVVNHNSQNNSDLIENIQKNDILNAEFDDDFYKNISYNIRLNLNSFIDGKIDRLQNRTVFERISSPPSATSVENVDRDRKQKDSPNKLEKEIHEATNFELSTPFPALLTVEQYGFGDSNPNKNRRQITKNSWKWKWDLIKKYKYVNEGGKIVKKVKQITTGLKDLSQLDMWTQLSMRSRYENLNNQNDTNDFPDDDDFNDNLSTRMIKTQNIEQLNCILDKRLTPEINIEQLQQTLVKEELIENGEETIKYDTNDLPNSMELEILNMLQLSKSNVVKISNPALSGEWARPRCFVCVDCGQEFDLMKSLNDHKNSEHPYVVSAHYEIVGRENLEQKLYKNLFLPKKALQSTENSKSQISISSDSKSNEASSSSENSFNSIGEQKEKECSKCLKMIKYSNDIEIYRHILDCIEDRVWMQAKRRNKYRRSRRKSKKNVRKSRLSVDQKKTVSSPFQKEIIEGENSVEISVSNSPTPKEEKKPILNIKSKTESLINDVNSNGNDGMNIKSFFRVSKTTPLLPQKMVVQMIEMPPNTHNNNNSLRHSLRSSTKKLSNSQNSTKSLNTNTKSSNDQASNRQNDEFENKTISNEDATESLNVKEETINDNFKNTNNNTVSKENLNVGATISTILPPLQIPDIDNKTKSLNSPINSSLVSPCSSVPKKKKKLNDCIAMLTCKIQEKLGVNFFENVATEIFPSENASKHEQNCSESLITLSSQQPSISISPSTPVSITHVPHSAFISPVQEEVIDLSIRKKPETNQEMKSEPADEKIVTTQSDFNDKITNKDCLQEQSDVKNESNDKTDNSLLDVLKQTNESIDKADSSLQLQLPKEAAAEPLSDTEIKTSESTNSNKNLINIKDIKESFKISIAKIKIPNLQEILDEKNTITVNNIKISESERRAFEEQKNRIMQILSKTKKTNVKKTNKKLPVKKTSANKKNANNKPQVPTPLVEVNSDAILCSKSKDETIISPENKNDSFITSLENMNETTISPEIKDETITPISDSIQTPPKEAEINTTVSKDESEAPKVEVNMQGKIEEAIKTTNRIRCRRLSVVVDPIIHLSAFQQSNRKIRLTNNSQQNGLYDLLTNDQLFNVIKPQLKNEIRKNYSKPNSKVSTKIQQAIKEVCSIAVKENATKSGGNKKNQPKSLKTLKITKNKPPSKVTKRIQKLNAKKLSVKKSNTKENKAKSKQEIKNVEPAPSSKIKPNLSKTKRTLSKESKVVDDILKENPPIEKETLLVKVMNDEKVQAMEKVSKKKNSKAKKHVKVKSTKESVATEKNSSLESNIQTKDSTPELEKAEEKLPIEILLSSDTSNENDIPLAKLINPNEKLQTEKVNDNSSNLIEIEKSSVISKTVKANGKNKKKQSTKKKVLSPKNKNQKSKTHTDDQSETEIIADVINENVEIDTEKKVIKGKNSICKTNGKKYKEKFDEKLENNEITVVIEKLNEENYQMKAKDNDSENHEVFNMNEDSFFNDDNDIDQSDEKINDIVNNIINSSELIDSETERNDQSKKDFKENQTEAKCFICNKSFRNEKVLEKHRKTNTHLLKEKRKEKKITELKEKEAQKDKEKEIVKVSENHTNAISDETKIFRTKGALKQYKTFDNILPIPSDQKCLNDIKEYDDLNEFKPISDTIDLDIEVQDMDALKTEIITVDDDDDDDDDDKNDEELSTKDKIFDSLFSNIENKLQAAAASNNIPLQKFAFPTLTPHDSEVESSSTSWDLKHDADIIEWDADNNDNNAPAFANAMKEKYPKKCSMKVNKSKETAVSIPTKSLIMGKIFKKHRDREKQKTPQADAPNNKPGIKNSLDEIFEKLKNSSEIDDKVLTCPSPKTLLKSTGATFSPHSSHSNDMLETASQSNNNNIYSNKSSVSTSSTEKSKTPERKKKDEVKKILINCDSILNEVDNDNGIGKRKSRRRCAIKTKTFAETWSSDEYEELHDTNDIISIINEIEKRESNKKRKVSKSESNSETNKKFDSMEPTNEDYHHKPQIITAVTSSILKSTDDEIVEKKSTQTSDKNEKKKSVHLQFPTSDVVKEKSNVNTIKKRRVSTLKDGHKSDDETFTATKEHLKPLKPSMSMLKKRRMSCFVPSTIFHENPKPAKLTKNNIDIFKKMEKEETVIDFNEKFGKNHKKILNAVCNISSTSIKKKVQKHRKRPRNKVKNIAYDSDSDFELNLSKKSKTSAFSDSYSEDEEDEEVVVPTNATKVTTSQNALIKSTSNTNELIMKEPKLLPQNDLNVVTSTTLAKAAIPEDINDSIQNACNRTKRHSSEKLYYWSSSSSESDLEHGDTADGENNEDSIVPQQPEQHGWIVGDSHKKLVTLLAHAKIKNKIN